MSLRGQNGLTPIACLTIEDWTKIHRFCQIHDVEVGGDYDASFGGAINVYMAANWIRAEAGMHGTFYPEPSQRDGWINVFWQTGTYGATIDSVLTRENVIFSTDGNWSAAMARNHWCQLYEKAIGKRYSISIRDFGGRVR